MSANRHEVNSLHAWIVCLSAGLFFFYEFFQLNIFDVLNPIFRHELNLNAANLSLLASTFIWANTLFLIPAGILLDNYSVKSVILITLFFCLLGELFILSGSNLSLIFLGRFLTGIGNAFCFVACIILISRWFTKDKKALLVGCIVTMAFIGGLIAHTPFAFIITIVGWRTALWINLGLGILIFLWLSYYLEDSSEIVAKKSEINAKEILNKFYSVLKNQQIYLAGSYTALLNLPVLVLGALWGVSYLEITYGISRIEASFVVSGLYFGSIVACPLLGWLSDKQGKRKPIMWFGVIGSLITLIVMMFLHINNIYALFSLFTILGVCTSAQVLSYPLIAETNDPTKVGEATAVASLIIMGSGACAQILFAFLVDCAKNDKNIAYTAHDFQYAVWLFPVAIVIAGILLLRLRENCKWRG